MNYKYNEEKECFIREDGLGKKYWINSSEAQRIMTLYDLGNSIGEIRNKITFSSRKVYESTIENFVKNVKGGKIEIPTDIVYVPTADDLTIEHRIANLEDEVTKIKIILDHQVCDCNKEEDKSIVDKFRSLFNYE
jgi:hypothetical protein